MESFERHIYESIIQSIANITADVSDRIYALSFFICDDEDDPRRPTLTFGFNTLDQWTECTPAAASTERRFVGSDAAEAKWNYAFSVIMPACMFHSGRRILIALKSVSLDSARN